MIELRQLVIIFWRKKTLAIIIVGLFLALGLVIKHFMPISYQAVLNLGITRAGQESTQDYHFDHYYRLQADERFAETLCRWLESPRVAQDIFQEAGLSTQNMNLRKLSGYFKARKMSSQFVKVTFVSQSPEDLRKLSQSVVKVVNRKAEELNSYQKTENWFVIVGDDPIIRSKIIHWQDALVFSFLLGLFFAFWIILISHYIKV